MLPMLDLWTKEQNIIREFHQKDFEDLDKTIGHQITWTKKNFEISIQTFFGQKLLVQKSKKHLSPSQILQKEKYFCKEAESSY